MYGEDRDHRNKRTRDWHRNNPERSYLDAAKKRAREQGVPFNLTVEDIVFPDVCPVLGIPVVLEKTDGPRKRTNHTPSLDRIVPELGYVKDNVVMVSWRANRLKNDASLDELKKLVEYMEKRP